MHLRSQFGIVMLLHRRCVSKPLLPVDLPLPATKQRVAPLASIPRRTLVALAATALGAGLAHAQEQAPMRDAALLKKLEQMEQRIRTLEQQLKQKDARAIEGTRGQATNAAVPPANVATNRKDAENTSARTQRKDQNEP